MAMAAPAVLLLLILLPASYLACLTLAMASVVAHLFMAKHAQGGWRAFGSFTGGFVEWGRSTGILREPVAEGFILCLLDPGMGFASHDISCGSPAFLASSPSTLNQENIEMIDEPRKQAATSLNCFLQGEEESLGHRGSMRSSSKLCTQIDGLNVDEELRWPYELPPPWSFSLLDSLQSMSSPTFHHSEQYSERSWSFEKQSGWDQFLCTRLGSSWQCEPALTEPSLEHEEVKVWSGQQKRLLHILKIDEVTTSAIDLGCKSGFAGIGNREGELSLWDLERGICVTSVCSLETPMSAQFMGSTDSPNGMAVGGTISRGRRMAFAHWDYRCSCDPYSNWRPIANIPQIAALKCRGHNLCLAGEDNLWMHDLRMLKGTPVIAFPTELARNLNAATGMATEVEAISLWENGSAVAIEEDEAYWDECHTVIAQGASCQDSGSVSLMSRCVVYIRSLCGDS